MTIAEIQQRSRNVHRQIERIANRSLRRIHIPAKGLGNNRTARFSSGRSHTDAAEKRMQRNFDFVIRIQSLEGSGVASMINRIEPDLLRQGRMNHRGVVGGVQRAKSRPQRAKSLVAINLQVQKLNNQRVAGFRTVDEERPRQWIVALDQRQ